jgi:hypothetical protein
MKMIVGRAGLGHIELEGLISHPTSNSEDIAGHMRLNSRKKFGLVKQIWES